MAKIENVIVYKFGGASVKDASAVRHISKILKSSPRPLIVVISAMGKITNALEEVVNAYFDHHQLPVNEAFQRVRNFHQSMVDDLMKTNTSFQKQLNELLDALWKRLEQEPSLNYDFEYDQIVSFGEVISTAIVSGYLNQEGILNKWVDIRPVLKTNDVYRDAGIDWPLSTRFIKATFSFVDTNLYITQGFIGSTQNNLTTTLGREGSDYSAAILGHVMDASHVTIWKDVAGVLNADPRWYPNAVKLDEISYWEAIELTYFGAQVIHPKTLKPLQNKLIPLHVKSFINSNASGTIIKHIDNEKILMPVFILKQNQIFVTISPRDFSFIMEDNLSDIFATFSQFRVKMNLMQNSALNFSACIDTNRNVDSLYIALKKRYTVRYNEDVELITIRHYNEDAIGQMTDNKEVIDSQITRKTARFVMISSPWRLGSDRGGI